MLTLLAFSSTLSLYLPLYFGNVLRVVCVSKPGRKTTGLRIIIGIVQAIPKKHRKIKSMHLIMHEYAKYAFF